MITRIYQESTHNFAIEVYKKNDTFVLKIDYNAKLFKANIIKRAMTHYINFLTSLVSNLEQISLAQLNMLSTQ